MTLPEFLENKNIVILGFGKQGKATYNYIRRHFPNKKITIADINETIDKNEIDSLVELKLGKNYLEDIDKFDIIIKAPGVVLKDVDTHKFQDKIFSDYDLFLKFGKGKKIGITGTKGKSTTATVLYNSLIENGKKAYLLGNIGNPILDNIDAITEDDYSVIEVSSHTLEFAKFSPDIAILLNIYPEHLDHCNSIDDYVKAKFNIAKFQTENDYFIYNGENEIMQNFRFTYKPNDIVISKDLILNKAEITQVYLENSGIYLKEKNNFKFLMNANEERKIKGEHTLFNMMFILATSEILKLDLNLTIKAIKETNGLSHRLEYVGKFNGIDFYDDSIATIPQATINNIKALGNVNTLICGGMDRGVSMTPLIEFLKNSQVENIICMPETGYIVYENLKNTKKVEKVKTLSEAVRIAKEKTANGGVCLLSPAASSYNDFKNFEEKGDIFKDLVKK